MITTLSIVLWLVSGVLGGVARDLGKMKEPVLQRKVFVASIVIFVVAFYIVVKLA